MSNRSNRVLGWLAVACLALASPALADHHEGPQKGTKQGGPSAEQRAKMADTHQRMAECLRSSRPINECQSEMKKSCRSMGGGSECSMGYQGGRGKGQGQGAATVEPSATTEPTGTTTTTDPAAANDKAKGKGKGQAGKTKTE